MMTCVIALKPALQRFDWGSRRGIPELLGFEPDGGPYAEAWWGAHPLAPSELADGTTLDAYLASDPEVLLGADVAREYLGLPYLLKVLAIARPLSIQVHPALERARCGFEDEESRGVDLRDSGRIFKDASHKPELLFALSTLTVLSGFRPEAELAADLESLGPDARPLLDALNAGGLQGYVSHALHGDRSREVAALEAKGSACGEAGRIAARALEVYPGDPGALVALAMNPVVLSPGEAVFTDAGVVHCYVEGLGVEIMANSDNVVRAGLTHKPINIDLLVDLVRFEASPPALVTGDTESGARVLRTKATEFALAAVDTSVAQVPAAPRIVLALEGAVKLTVATGEQCSIVPGQAVFVPHVDGDLTVAAEGLCVVATVGTARD